MPNTRLPPACSGVVDHRSGAGRTEPRRAAGDNGDPGDRARRDHRGLRLGHESRDRRRGSRAGPERRPGGALAHARRHSLCVRRPESRPQHLRRLHPLPHRVLQPVWFGREPLRRRLDRLPRVVHHPGPAPRGDVRPLSAEQHLQQHGHAYGRRHRLSRRRLALQPARQRLAGSRSCLPGYLATQAVDLAVAPDSSAPNERYELEDEIALRNSTPAASGARDPALPPSSSSRRSRAPPCPMQPSRRRPS